MDWFLHDRDLRHERVNLHAYGHLLRKKSARMNIFRANKTHRA